MPETDQEYELMAYSERKIDYEYIIQLIQNIVSPSEDEEPNWDWFILLVAKTGMRFSEALAITPSDFDFSRQTLYISKTWDYKNEGGFMPTKNKSSIRKIQIDWQIVVMFSELIKGLPEDKPIFVGDSKIYNSTVNDKFNELNLDTTCKLNFILFYGILS